MTEVRRYLDAKKAKLEKNREKDAFVTFSVKSFCDYKYNATESRNKLDCTLNAALTENWGPEDSRVIWINFS